MKELTIKMYAVTIDCLDPYALAKFYAELLHWDIPFFNEEFACLGPKGIGQGGYPGITFQRNPDYQPPVWPEEPEKQQQMVHLDFAVNELDEAVSYAVKCGATVAEQQFSDSWRVMLDPSGHPFCLCELGSMFESPEFALL